VASTAAFQPGRSCTYYAQTYALSLSEALAEEYADKGIVVTALCPGPTRTGFQKRAAMEQARLVQGGLMDARAVAESGYRGLMKGQRVIVPGMLNRLGALMTRFVPRRMATRLVMTMHQRVGQ
jgi:short-subunit dehydrogenase